MPRDKRGRPIWELPEEGWTNPACICEVCGPIFLEETDEPGLLLKGECVHHLIVVREVPESPLPAPKLSWVEDSGRDNGRETQP